MRITRMMRSDGRWRQICGGVLALMAAAWLAGCGGDDPPPPPPPSVGSATVDASGGFVDGPDGVRLAVPPEATGSGVTFRIARDGSGAPAVPDGVDLVSAVYSITPHGQAFNLPVAVRLPSSPAQAAGRPTFLMKAAPGGRWAVIGTADGAATALQASIDTLSYFAVGACTSNLPPGSIGAQNCPTSNVLRFELLTDGGTPFPVSQDTTYGAIQPVLLVTTPTTLTGRFIWTRAPLTLLRTDRLDTGSRAAGTGGGVVIERQAGIAWSTEAPDDLDVTQDVVRTFTITVTPAQVAGAAGPNGVVRPLWAQAVAGPWEYDALIPIRIRDVGAPAPAITQQPADAGVVEGQTATFTVVAAGSGLTYQWLRRPAGSTAFAPIGGATAAGYTTPAATLADNGAQFQVQVCAGASPCTTSNTATLSVAQAPVQPAFSLQPASTAIVAGQTASFTATASGVPTPRIRWQTAAPNSTSFSDLNVTGCAETAPASSGSSTTATCTVGPFATGDSGRRYRALAISSIAPAGVPSDAATLTVSAAPTAPSITMQPTAQSTTAGGSATFTVVATGTASLGYTWRINGSPLQSSGSFMIGACTGTVAGTGASLTLTGLSAGCNGVTVTVVVSNGINPDATSDPAILTVSAVGPGLSLLAGAIGGPGTVDGTGSEARVTPGLGNFIAADAFGTAYFSETVSNTVRKITAAGVVTTIDSGLRAPEGVAVDSAGNAYVAERGNHRILRYTPTGVRSVFIGGIAGDQDGVGAAARLINPGALAIDAADNLYLVQGNGDAVKIRKITPGLEVTTVHDFGGSFNGVGAIAVASDGSAIFGAGGGPAWFGTVVRIAGGNVTIVAGAAGETGNVDGIGAAARFSGLGGLVRAANGDLFVTDSNNLTVRRITPAGEVTTVSGAQVFPSVPVDASGTAGRYEFPGPIGRLPNGDLLIADGPLLRRLASTSSTFDLSTVAGRRLETGTVDGSGSAARFRPFVAGVALDTGGNAYVADFDRIRVVTPAGVVSTLVSQRGQFIVRDVGSGFVVASTNAVWRMTAAGVATLLAGDPQSFDYVDAPVGTDARFGAIRGIAVDGSGNVFVAETVNQNATIRRITPVGEVTTWAGAKDALPATVDGDRLAARFSFLTGGLAVDADGNLLVADSALLRRITPQGTVSTFVGAGAGMLPAFQLAFEAGGSLLAGGDATLQRISTGGAVSTLIGAQSVRGVKLGAAPQLNLVGGMAVRPSGQVVIKSEAAVLELTLP